MTTIKPMSETQLAAALEVQGKADAEALQLAAPEMDGTSLNGAAEVIPMFSAAVKVRNMLERPAGFVCISDAGRVVRLLQPYDSDIFTQQPEMLPAQWGFVWSKDPAHARPFVALSTSPYNLDEVCSWGAEIYASTLNGNVWSPADYPQGWRKVGEITGR